MFDVNVNSHLKYAERSDQGSPQGPAAHSMPSSVAFADSKHCLEDYCPLIKVSINRYLYSYLHQFPISQVQLSLKP